MNLNDAKYSRFALVKEMLETPDIIRKFDLDRVADTADRIKSVGKLFLTGEGSSRIFPAKNAICQILQSGLPLAVATEGCTQAMEYDLSDWAVFGASNSGQTKELIRLFKKLEAAGNANRFGLTANAGTKLEEVSTECYQLTCGREDAVAATKSVVEQALFYQSIIRAIRGGGCCDGKCADVLAQLADAGQAVMEAEYDAGLVQKVVDSPIIYFAGRNNGVAEELTLKTNEITRKKSDYLEGTYAVHGIEEVMNPEEVVVWIDPNPSEIEKFSEVLVDGVGMTVIAVATEETPFPTIRIPDAGPMAAHVQLMAGWNILIRVGVACGIDLDKPERARKIGNEFTE